MSEASRTAVFVHGAGGGGWEWGVWARVFAAEGWAVLAPGRRTRGAALREAAPDAFGLLAGACLILVVAGLIEAFVTPHFPAAVRWATAAASALFLIAYFGLAGRRHTSPLLPGVKVA